MGTTTTYAFRYPGLSDSPNVPQSVQNLATDLDNATFAKPPCCWLVQQSAQTGWTTATPTAVTFGASSEVIDTDALHDTGSNTSRIVIGKKLGWWEVGGVYCTPGNSNTVAVRAYLYFNGSPITGGVGGFNPATGTTIQAVVTPTILVQATSVTDYVELYGWQTAGAGTLGTAISGPVAPSFLATWKRPS